MSTALWIVVVLSAVAVAFLAGVAFGRFFWLDVRWMKTRR